MSVGLEQLINLKETLVYMNGDHAYTWDGEITFKVYIAQGYRESWELVKTRLATKDNSLSSAKEYAIVLHNRRQNRKNNRKI